MDPFVEHCIDPPFADPVTLFMLRVLETTLVFFLKEDYFPNL